MKKFRLLSTGICNYQTVKEVLIGALKRWVCLPSPASVHVYANRSTPP
jgi:hypothetical protein